MDIETARLYCLSLPCTTEDTPFGPDDLAIRVMGKIFAFFDLERPNMMVLKCEQNRAEELRDIYEAIEPAWHWNKKYWNQIWFDKDVNSELLEELILHSYHEVVRKFPKKLKEEYNKAINNENN